MIGIIIGAAAAVVAALTAVILINLRKKAKKREEYERFLSTPEPKSPSFAPIPKFEYSSHFEELINKRFSRFIEACNAYMAEFRHAQYLEKRREALVFLKKEAKDGASVSAISESKTKAEHLHEEMEKIHWYNYSQKDATAETVEIFNKFKALSSAIPGAVKPSEPMRSFSPQGKKWIDLSMGAYLMLSEFYVALWDSSTYEIRIYSYEDVEVNSDYTVISLPFGVSPKKTDEVVRKHYKHEREDGTPDKRYSDNPVKYDVYRGHLIFTVGNREGRVDVGGRKTAEQLERKIGAYVRHLSTKANSKYFDYIANATTLYFKMTAIEEGIALMTVKEMAEAERAKLARQKEKEEEKLKREKEKAEERERKEEEKRLERERKEEEKRAEAARREEEKKAEAARREESRFTKDEVRMILEARRQKEAEEKAMAEGELLRASMERINSLSEPPITQVGSTRVITNNLFSFTYTATEPLSALTLYFCDERERVISEEFTVASVGSGESFRATFTLMSGIEFDTDKTYYLIVKDKVNDKMLGKLDYNIRISFVSDFDF